MRTRILALVLVGSAAMLASGGARAAVQQAPGAGIGPAAHVMTIQYDDHDWRRHEEFRRREEERRREERRRHEEWLRRHHEY